MIRLKNILKEGNANYLKLDNISKNGITINGKPLLKLKITQEGSDVKGLCELGCPPRKKGESEAAFKKRCNITYAYSFPVYVKSKTPTSPQIPTTPASDEVPTETPIEPTPDTGVTESPIKEKSKGIQFVNFAEKRGEGADKIATTAKEKGGLALLTYHHFKVKEPYYKNATEGEFDKAQAIQEFNQTLKSISLNMGAVEFQTEVGRLEVLGELIINTKTNGR